MTIHWISCQGVLRPIWDILYPFPNILSSRNSPELLTSALCYSKGLWPHISVGNQQRDEYKRDIFKCCQRRGFGCAGSNEKRHHFFVLKMSVANSHLFLVFGWENFHVPCNWSCAFSTRARTLSRLIVGFLLILVTVWPETNTVLFSVTTRKFPDAELILLLRFPATCLH